jgi:hypothetical protein
VLDRRRFRHATSLRPASDGNRDDFGTIAITLDAETLAGIDGILS